MASILQPVMFGLFFNALLRFLGLPTSLATAAGGGLTRAPRRLIPLATILITVIPGVFWMMLTSYAIVEAVPVGVMVGQFMASGGQLLIFLVLLPYLAVNLANLVYHLRWRRDEFNWLVNGLVPLLGIAIDGYVIYYAFFRTLLSLPFKQGSSIVWAGVAWELLGVCWTAVAWRR